MEIVPLTEFLVLWGLEWRWRQQMKDVCKWLSLETFAVYYRLGLGSSSWDEEGYRHGRRANSTACINSNYAKKGGHVKDAGKALEVHK